MHIEGLYFSNLGDYKKRIFVSGVHPVHQWDFDPLLTLPLSQLPYKFCFFIRRKSFKTDFKNHELFFPPIYVIPFDRFKTFLSLPECVQLGEEGFGSVSPSVS